MAKYFKNPKATPILGVNPPLRKFLKSNFFVTSCFLIYIMYIDSYKMLRVRKEVSLQAFSEAEQEDDPDSS